MKHHIDFIVNEEKRTIVAILRIDPVEVALEMSNIVDKAIKPNLTTIVPFETGFLVKDTYRGKAICHKDDEWDVVKGKRIAKAKALYAFMKDHKKITAQTVASLEDALERAKAADHYSDYTLRNIIENLDKE